jgi:hypothetical protein
MKINSNLIFEITITLIFIVGLCLWVFVGTF